MDLDAGIDFARTHHRAILATTRGDGRSQLSPVTVGVDADRQVIISTRETAAKVHNLRRRPYASVVVLDDAFFGAFVQLEGPVEIVELPAALDRLVDYYRSISGEHPDWDEYRAAMVEQRRVVVRVRVERAGPDRQG